MNSAIGVPGSQIALPNGVTFGANSLSLPDGLTFEQWEAVGHQLRSCQRALNWWIGDWLAYGQITYKDHIHGHRLENGITKFASELLGVEEGTLRCWKWISNAVSLSTRVDKLTWSQAREIVCGAKENHISMWVDKAVKEDLTYRDLRKAIREFYSEEKPDPYDAGEDSFLEDTRQYMRDFGKKWPEWPDDVADRYLYEEYAPLLEWAQMRLSRRVVCENARS